MDAYFNMIPTLGLCYITCLVLIDTQGNELLLFCVLAKCIVAIYR